MKNIKYGIIICKLCGIVLHESKIYYLNLIVAISPMNYCVRPLKFLLIATLAPYNLQKPKCGHLSFLYFVEGLLCVLLQKLGVSSSE